ncbi:MAG: ATP-binding protein [Chitinophagaceae bacterium]
MAEQVPQRFEEFFAPLDIWIDVSAYPSEEGLSIYFKNISQRKLADEKIRAAKQRYEMVAMATNDAIYEWDMASDTIYWNEGFETLFGHKRTGDIMPTSTWIDNLHPDEKEKLFAITYDAFKNKKTSLTRELLFRCADGSYKIVFDKLIIRYDTNGQPTGIFGAMQDITDRRQNEIAIRELNAQLNKRAEELLSSNNELERFAYVASHDLQEPLRMVSSFLQLLEKKYKSSLDETADQYIRYAVDGAERMKRLILDLLEYSRVGTSKEVFVETDMSKVITQVLETFSSKLKKTEAITKVQLMPVIKASETQMTQLLQNLVGNSLKYNTSAVPEIEIGCEDKSDCWEFFVKDNGIGIEKKFFEKVFVIFQRLHNKNRFSGTGIGLAICKKIVEKHGGNIWIDSVAGAGTTFFFTIKK